MPLPETTKGQPLSPAEREQLRGLIAHACEPVAQFWPMRTFIHHNPLHGLETLPFDHAIREAERLIGARGYPVREEHRALCRTGRVTAEGLRRALRRLVPWVGEEGAVLIGPSRITAEDVLVLHLCYGIDPTIPMALHWRRTHEDATARFRDDVPLATRQEALARIAASSTLEADRLERDYIGDLWQATLETLKLDDDTDGGDAHAGGGTSPHRVDRARTLADRMREEFGIDLVDQINQEMIKWSAAFVDEGLADWAMPSRELGFYTAWRGLAIRDQTLRLLGATGWADRIHGLPEAPEDAVVDSLRRLGVPDGLWQDYFSRHLAQLPGWAGFIRWRGENLEYEAQRRHPISTVDYLAVRLFYEREFARGYGVGEGRPDSVGYLRASEATDNRGSNLARLCRDGWRWFHLAQFLAVSPADVRRLSPRTSQAFLDWLDRFPQAAEAPVLLEAYEEEYRRTFLGMLASSHRRRVADPAAPPEAQAVFCIDVRSEPFRRHLEAQGDFETFGFAGFFGVPLRYRGFDQCNELDLCPVLVKPKHRVSELPRPGQQPRVQAYATGSAWQSLAQHLFHDLKSSPLASVALIDVLGLFFTAGLVGKTVLRLPFTRLRERIRRWLAPPLRTHVRTAKASPEEAEAWLASQERAAIAQWLWHQPDRLRQRLGEDPQAIEHLRRAALELERPTVPEGLLEDLRGACELTPRVREARLEQLALHGFTVAEQANFVEAGLRLYGLTTNFAPLVLLCGHGSATENNPYAAALDCGACGGSHGDPNARVLASMANRVDVRAALRERGIVIPDDTRFLAGKHNTTTDEVKLYDLEDLPPTHHAAVDRLVSALARTRSAAAVERCGRLPGTRRGMTPEEAVRTVLAKSADWAQVRPEWGLSSNAAFLIGRRSLTKDLNLQARVFLHSYDPDQDPKGKALETIMTAPMIVGEWINMEHYFSAADPWAYGSGSKVIHNVVSGVGVMLGRQSDLQTGLPLQTVNNGGLRYHEPMRLLIVIEAPPDRITPIIQRHEILQHLLHNQWVTLTALDPDTWDITRYLPSGSWEPLRGQDLEHDC